MRAVLKHELYSNFTNLTGYVFGAFILLFAGIFTLVYNLDGMLTNFEYAVASMTIVYLVAIPILTMRILAEERKQKTDQLLYSLPLSMGQVILGKFAALLVMLLLPLAIIGLYPLVLRVYGNVYLPASYSTLLAFFLLGAALIAIGMFISSVTESQAVAAGICFVLMLLNYFLSDLSGYVGTSALASFVALAVVVLVLGGVIRLMTKSSFAALLVCTVLEAVLVGMYLINAAVFENLLPQVLAELSLFERFYGFADGVFDIAGIVYFLSVIGVFLFLSVQSMEKRRWSA